MPNTPMWQESRSLLSVTLYARVRNWCFGIGGSCLNTSTTCLETITNDLTWIGVVVGWKLNPGNITSQRLVNYDDYFCVGSIWTGSGRKSRKGDGES